MENAKDIIERIRQLCNRKHITTYKLIEKSKVSRTTMYNMMERESMPTLPVLFNICKGLDITPAQFFTETEIYELTQEEKELIETYRNLDDQHKERVTAYLQGIREMMK